MTITKRSLTALFAAAVTLLSVGSVAAQQQGEGRGPGGPGGQRGNFDPAQFQQRMMDRYREQLEIKDDAEWTAISGLIENVNTSRRESLGGFAGFGGRRGGQGGPGGQRGGRGGFGGEPSPEVTALQEAIDANAAPADLKAKLAKVQEVRKAKAAELAKAQQDLRAVLNARQEAIATLNGLL